MEGVGGGARGAHLGLLLFASACGIYAQLVEEEGSEDSGDIFGGGGW